MTNCEALAVGDPVAAYYYGHLTKNTVVRLTKNYVVISGSDAKYNRKRGEIQGGDHDWLRYIEPWAEKHDKALADERERVRRKQLHATALRLLNGRPSTRQFEAIIAILEGEP